MKLFLAILVCVVIVLSVDARYEAAHDHTSGWDKVATLISEFKSEFTTFKNKNYKIYKSEAEEQGRFANFVLSLIEISDHNDLYEKGQKTYKMRLNHMSDWTHDEREKLNGFRMSNSTGSMYLSSSIKVDLPESVDWRKEGAVTEVKNQKECGSCWAFSATGSLEGQIWKKTGKLISLSEQQIVDCDLVDDSCKGGLVGTAFNYVKNVGGIEEEKEYPYVSEYEDEPRRACRFKKEKVVASDTGYVQLPENDEDKLREAVATIGPISIAVSAPPALTFYDSGIFHDNTCAYRPLNHAVLLVGYGTEELTGTPYWIIKNSWGPHWGDNGYFRMERNIHSCNIGVYSMYPLV